jgi:RHS repeat-associated protein
MACRGLQPPVPRMERVQRMKARLVRSIGAVASRLSVSLITIAARSDGVDSAKPSPASTPRSAERPVTRNAAQVMLLLLTGLFAALVLVAQRVCSLRRLVEGLGWAASVAVIALLVPACQCSPSSEEGDDDDRSDEPRVITEVPEGAVFYLGDHQHSPVVLTNARGEVIRAAAYDPYGSVRHENGDRTDPFAYVGNEHDSGAELADFKARPYRPKAGIFLASDPVAVFAPEKLLKEPSRFAPYTYAGGNPTDRSDASGKLWDVVLDVHRVRRWHHRRRERYRAHNGEPQAEPRGARPGRGLCRATACHRRRPRLPGKQSCPESCRGRSRGSAAGDVACRTCGNPRDWVDPRRT